MAEQIIRLNIGGYKYQTTRSTLASRGENFFTKLLEGRIGSVKDEEGNYFIDRDGQYFQPILSFLRTGLLTLPEGMPFNLVDVEANFYLIDINSKKVVINTTQAHINFNGVYWTKVPANQIMKFKSESIVSMLTAPFRKEYKYVNETTIEVDITSYTGTSSRRGGDVSSHKEWYVVLNGEAIYPLTSRGATIFHFFPSIPPISNVSYSTQEQGSANQFAFTNEEKIILKNVADFPHIEPVKKITAGGIIKYSFKLDYHRHYHIGAGLYTIYSFGALLLVKIQQESGVNKYVYVVCNNK